MPNVFIKTRWQFDHASWHRFAQAIKSPRLIAAVVFLSATNTLAVKAQSGQPPVSQTAGSVPTGAPTRDVRHLTFRDAIEMALRYNLGAIESGESARAARGLRLQALSALLPQVSLGVSYNKAQVTAASLGFSSTPIIPIPPVIGPFQYSTVAASVSQIVVNL